MYWGGKEAAEMCPYWSPSPGSESLSLIAIPVFCPSVLVRRVHRLSYYRLIASQMRLRETSLPSVPALTS